MPRLRGEAHRRALGRERRAERTPSTRRGRAERDAPSAMVPLTPELVAEGVVGAAVEMKRLHDEQRARRFRCFREGLWDLVYALYAGLCSCFYVVPPPGSPDAFVCLFQAAGVQVRSKTPRVWGETMGPQPKAGPGAQSLAEGPL